MSGTSDTSEIFKFKPNSILILDLTYLQLQFQSGIQIFPPFSKGSKMFQNLLKCKQLRKIQKNSVQFSSSSAQDGRRRRNPETSRTIVFLSENIQLLYLQDFKF